MVKKKKLSFFLTATDWLLHIPCDAFIRNQTLFTVFPFLAPFSFPHECFNPNLSALFQITSNFCGACSIGGSLHSHPFIQKQSKCPSVNVTACHHHNSHLAPHLPFKIMRMQCVCKSNGLSCWSLGNDPDGPLFMCRLVLTASLRITEPVYLFQS